MIFALAAVAALLIAAIAGLIDLRVRLDEARRQTLFAERDFATRLGAKETERAALRAILDGVGEGLLAIDKRRQVVLANRRFVEMFSVQGDPVGKPLGEVLRVTAVFNACDGALGGRESSERFAISVGVAERRIELRALPIDSREIAVVAIFIDVTQLERLEQIRRNFISDFTHEVRTPLAGLTTAVETYELSGKLSGEDDRQLRRIMARQLKRLQRLVDDLAELSQIESGDLTLEIRDVDVKRLLEDLSEDFGKQHFAISGESAVVSGDALRLQQAFSNLFDNAIKYGRADDTIEVAIAAEASHAVVRVTDHGEGIGPEEREKIFRRFYRIDKSRSQDVTGTGLGLAITKHLVLLHRGSIDVESEIGKGSTFIVRLPLARVIH